MDLGTVTVIFLIGVVALLFWIRIQAAAREQELDAIAAALGLRQATHSSVTATWVDGAPPFRFLASGTNQRVEGRLTGDRSGVPFEILHYRCGSQTSSNHGQEYLVFSTTAISPGVRASTPSFSLVPSTTLDQRLARSDSTVVPMPGWTSLEDWSLWMHVDPTNPVTSSVSAEVLAGVSALVDRGEKVRVELIGGHFVSYVQHRGAIEQAAVERLIDDGFDLINRLG